MRLRRQLLLLGSLVLIIPWAGYEFVRETERALRDTQQDSLLTVARALAVIAADAMPPATPGSDVIFVHTLRGAMTVDGYGAEWGRLTGATQAPRYSGLTIDAGSEVAAPPPMRFVAGRDDQAVFLLIDVDDESINYFNPSRSRANGDRIYLSLPNGGEPTQLVLLTSAPGAFYARELHVGSVHALSAERPAIRGAWRETDSGFQLEVRIPDTLVGDRLDLFLVDSDAGREPRWWGTSPSLREPAGVALIGSDAALARRVRQFATPGTRLRVADPNGWVIADVDRLGETSGRLTLTVGGVTAALLQRLVRFILEQNALREARVSSRAIQRLGGSMFDEAASGRDVGDWYKLDRLSDAVVVVAVPVTPEHGVAGVLVAEQTSNSVVAVSGFALTRLVLYSLLALLLVTLGFLGYASLLSWRIRSLRDAVDRCVSRDGQIVEQFSVSRASDEIGDLSRHYAELLARIREHTDYLRKLARTLAHELRTPLAVVSSSLENLHDEQLDEQSRVYAERALQGSARLRMILHSLSEAGRVEQALESVDPQRFDLCELLGECVPAYRDVYPGSRIELTLPETGPVWLLGNGELIVQLLDKLVDNAVDFADPDTAVSVTLVEQPRGYVLGVCNQGRHLPEAVRARLFDPMVSMREQSASTPHLGIGLYIVKLIARMHRAQVHAVNLTGAHPGVCFEVVFPSASQAEA